MRKNRCFRLLVEEVEVSSPPSSVFLQWDWGGSPHKVKSRRQQDNGKEQGDGGID